MTEHAAVEAILANVKKRSDFLAHYGVKGMKWGVIRDRKKTARATGGKSTASGEKWTAKDKKWVDKVNADPKLVKISKKASRDAKKKTKLLNANYKNVNLAKDALARSRYDAELKTILNQSLAKASYDVHGLSPSRSLQFKITRFSDGQIVGTASSRSNAKILDQSRSIEKVRQRAERRAAKHADDDDVTENDLDGMGFLLVPDENGLIVDILTPYDDLQHSEELETFLAHYGVKGMKWGVRRTDKQLARAAKARKEAPTIDPEGVTRKLEDNSIVEFSVNRGTNKAQPISEDAESAKSVARRLRDYGPSVVTNKELNSYLERVNLEKRYNTLLAEQKQANRSKVRKMIDNELAYAKKGKKGPARKVGEIAINELVRQRTKSKGKHRK